MTTREDKRFAAACAAMQGMIANPKEFSDDSHVDIVKLSLVYADLLLEELEETGKIVGGVSDLDLSIRASQCLENANIVTLEQLVNTSEQALLKTRNFGRKSLREIKDQLAKRGLALK